MSTHPNALELAAERTWFKSSYSDDQGGTCVEVTNLIPAHIGVRDSKCPQGPALLLPASSFAMFVELVKVERP